MHPVSSLSRPCTRRAVLHLALAALMLGGSIHTAWADSSLTVQPMDVSGPVQVHLVYADRDGTTQDGDLASAPPALTNALPTDLQLSAKSPLRQLLHDPLTQDFGQLWSALQSEDCDSITKQIKDSINTSLNSAYDVKACTFGPDASLTAFQQSQWNEPVPGCAPCEPQTVNGQRILLDYWIPDNSIVFTVTTPFTCQQTSAVCTADPQMTAVFDMHILLTLTSRDPGALTCTFDVAASQYVGATHAVQGDYSGAIFDELVQAGKDFKKGLDQGDTIAAAALNAAVALAEQSAGIGVAAEGNQGLVDTVSSDLSLLVPASVNVKPVPGLDGFRLLAQGCSKAAATAGFSQFDASVTPDGSLRFTLTHPHEKMGPLTHISSAPSSSGGTVSFVHPQISVQPDSATRFTVNGAGFTFSDTAQVRVAWDDSFVGKALSESDVEWGPLGGQATLVTIPRKFGDGHANFNADSVSPNTTYQFRVRDCDNVTCSDFSDPLQVTTGAQGSNDVTLYLDGFAPTDQVGSGTVDARGNFTAIATIPSSTTAGQHTLTAVEANAGQGSAPLTGVGAILAHPADGIGTGAHPLALAANPASRGIARNHPITGVALPALDASSKSASVFVVDQAAPPVSAPSGVQVGLQSELATSPSGPQASATITVGADQSVQASIVILDPTTSTPTPTILEGSQFIARGAAFAPGGTVTVFLDNTSGHRFGTARVARDGTFAATFSMPNGFGNQPHSIAAVEVVNGQKTEASTSLFVSQIIR